MVMGGARLPARPNTAGTGRPSSVRLPSEDAVSPRGRRGSRAASRVSMASAAAATSAGVGSFWDGESDAATAAAEGTRRAQLTRPSTASVASYRLPTARFPKCDCGEGCWCVKHDGGSFGRSGAVGSGHIPTHVTPHGLGSYATDSGLKLTLANRNTTGYFDRNRVRGGLQKREDWQCGVTKGAIQKRTVKGGTFGSSARTAGWYATGGNSNRSGVQSSQLDVLTRDPFECTPDFFNVTRMEHQFSRSERGERPQRNRIVTELPPAGSCKCKPVGAAWTRVAARTADLSLPQKAASNAIRIGC